MAGFLLVMFPLAGLAAAQTEDVEPATTEGSGEPSQTVPGVDDQLLITGSIVYSQVCQACHQPGGAGLSGQFPPLDGNPNVMDADYVATTIANGKQGQITVLGETYNGRMPAFSTLSDSDVAAVIAYVQSGFVTPATLANPAPSGDESPQAGLPLLANYSSFLAFAIALGVGALVLAPRLTSTNDRLSMPWLDASFKSALIVVGFVLFVVLVPSWAMRTETVSALDRSVQDLVGVGLWFSGLGAGIWALWYAQREDRI